jgi:hypothetical protein
MLIRPSGIKFETKAKCVEMPASWATSLHSITWWPSKSLLTMLTITTNVTHCCWCFAASFTSYEAYITTTKATCLMGHCATICLWFHKFLAISVYFKVFTMCIWNFHLQVLSHMWHSMQDISYFATSLCRYNRTHKHNSILAYKCASHLTQKQKQLTILLPKHYAVLQ